MGVFLSLQQAVNVASAFYNDMYGLTGEEGYGPFRVETRNLNGKTCYDFIPNADDYQRYIRVQEQNIDLADDDGNVLQA